MRTLLAAALLSVLLAVAPLALANDSVAEVALGGLTLLKSDGIAMKSEDLTISQSEVKVRYVFRNETSAPIKTTVAFPLPEWEKPDEDWGDVALDLSEGVNFDVTVDGKEISYRTKVARKGRSSQITYYWKQTYPPHRDVVVEHSYSPGAGGFFVGPGDTANDKFLAKTYCVGPKLLAALHKKEVWVRTVSYILSTGANWKGPIGRFRLTLVKENPRDKISLCEDGTRKTSATTFVVERTNFTPEGDLDILFIPGDN